MRGPESDEGFCLLFTGNMSPTFGWRSSWCGVEVLLQALRSTTEWWTYQQNSYVRDFGHVKPNGANVRKIHTWQATLKLLFQSRHDSQYIPTQSTVRSTKNSIGSDLQRMLKSFQEYGGLPDSLHVRFGSSDPRHRFTYFYLGAVTRKPPRT